MLTGALAAAAVLGVAKVVRDWLVLRQVRAALEGCSVEDRVRIGMRLAAALGGREEAPPAEGEGEVRPRR
ncbi:hypothetical protein ABT084_25925 [Streptomyces sp. NPDC002138]|uniref:hypothetical protein n=1 Tax=Streptomyces sp. NPDC002138 TaxID=3154410 RepID=UPI00331F8607